MAGTRTAPDVTGTATSMHLSVHFIDDSNDMWSESHIIPAASTAAQREAYLDGLQALSGASIYKVGVESMFGTDALADSGNADANVGFLKSRSVFDALNVTLKHNTDPEKKNKVVRVPAPIASAFINNFVETDPLPPTFVSDTINGSSTELATLMAAALTMFGAGWSIAWARFSEKTELNPKTRI
jgi:hypothetical protein